jgi:hypothetical protein
MPFFLLSTSCPSQDVQVGGGHDGGEFEGGGGGADNGGGVGDVQAVAHGKLALVMDAVPHNQG